MAIFWGLPSSATAKSEILSPCMALPALSLTVTSAVTSREVVEKTGVLTCACGRGVGVAGGACACGAWPPSVNARTASILVILVEVFMGVTQKAEVLKN